MDATDGEDEMVKGYGTAFHQYGRHRHIGCSRPISSVCSLGMASITVDTVSEHPGAPFDATANPQKCALTPLRSKWTPSPHWVSSRHGMLGGWHPWHGGIGADLHCGQRSNLCDCGTGIRITSLVVTEAPGNPWRHGVRETSLVLGMVKG